MVDVVSSEVDVDAEVGVSSGGVVVVESAGVEVGVSSGVEVMDAGFDSGVDVVESVGNDDVVSASIGIVPPTPFVAPRVNKAGYRQLMPA